MRLHVNMLEYVKIRKKKNAIPCLDTMCYGTHAIFLLNLPHTVARH